MQINADKRIFHFSRPNGARFKNKSLRNIRITVDRLPKLTEDKFSGSRNAIGSTIPVESTKAENKSQTTRITFV